MNTDFSEWLVEELKSKNWSQADLSRNAGISRAAVSDIISRKYSVGFEVCNAISRAFNIPPEVVFRKAGLIPEAPEVDDSVAAAMAIFASLSKEDRMEFLAYLQIKDKLSKERKNQLTDSNASPEHERL